MVDRRLEITISGDASKFISELKKAGVQVKDFSDDSKKAGTGVSDLAGSLGFVTSPAGLAAAAITATGAAMIFSVNAARESRVAQAGLVSVLESTKNASGQTIASLNAHAAALQKVTNFDDEAIAGGQELLLTFTKIGGDAFPRATKAALDLSTRFDTDLKSASIMVGKALNDPIAGLTALRRVGVDFTEQQQEQIKTMAEVGDVAGAQAIIFEVLDTQTKNAAEAARLADGGFVALQNSVGNLSEAFGEGLMTTMGGSVETLVSFTDSMTQAVEWASQAAAAHQLLVERGQSLGTVWLDAMFNQDALSAAIRETTEAQTKQDEQLGQSTEELQAYLAEQAKQAEILQANKIATADYYSNIFEMQDERVKSEQEANLKIAQSQSDANAAMAANTQSLNEHLAELNNERIEAKNELAARGAEMSDAEYEAEMTKINTHYDEMIAKTNESYMAQNGEIQAKLKERQLAIEEQQAKEKAAYEEHLLDLKLKTSLGILERTGQLDELTGNAGLKAEEVFDLIKGGVLKADGELLSGINGAYQKFEQGQADAKQTAETSIASLTDVFSGKFTEIATAHTGMTKIMMGNYRDLEVSALSAASVQSGASGGSTGPGYATGGTFTVPPGYPNDSYNMRVSSGETVTVQNNYNLTTQTAMDSAGVSRDFQFMQMFA